MDGERIVRALSVSSLRRYPVKSMGGEQLHAADITASGVAGDRAFALVNKATRKVGSAKSRRFGELPMWHAEYVEGASPGSSGVVRITAPNGRRFRSDSSEASDWIQAAFGRDVELQSRSTSGLVLELPPGTLGGKHVDTTQVPLAGAAPGTFLDLAPIHMITTATLRRLEQLMPGGIIDAERFRPNIVVDCAGEIGVLEDDWTGRRLTLGSVELRVMMPCPRCVMATLARPRLDAMPALLRTLAKENSRDLGEYGNLPCAGIYCEVMIPGAIRVGDRVALLD